MIPRYPVYVPSRGRAEHARRLTSTVGRLMEYDVPFRIVVEPQEAEAYTRVVGRSRVLVLPLRDRGTSTPARNWIRDHAEAEGAARHWQLDDNIKEFRRLYRGRRIICHAGLALRVCEDMTDRYENVAISGLNYQMFVPDHEPVPFRKNVHIYSCTLVNHAWPGRWRLAYNEDTDLCLQALVGGWCTLSLNAFMANKERTMVNRGGNTESLYNADRGATDTDGRFRMAEVLRRAWPGLVEVRRRFGRFQHVINWKAFETPLLLRDGVDLAALPPVDEYGLRLRAVREIRSPTLRALLADHVNEHQEVRP
jgi:hypothetical protein